MKINPVFTNFIAVDDIDINNQKVIDFCLRHRQKDHGRFVSNHGGYQSNNIVLKECLPELHNEISKRLDELHYYFEFKDSLRTIVTDAWININGKHDFNTVHDHGGGLFSGVYYVSANDDTSTLEFMTPIAAHTFAMQAPMIKTQNPFNSNIMKVLPKTGMLVIFPSWLMHYTRPNETDMDRISISFNSYPS